jgi:hypothetical protein
MSRTRLLSKILRLDGLIKEDYVGVYTSISGVELDTTTGNLIITAGNGATYLSDLGSYFDTKIETLIGDAPEDLDSLTEMAAALGDDPTFFLNLNIQTMTTASAVIDLQDKYIQDHP